MVQRGYITVKCTVVTGYSINLKIEQIDTIFFFMAKHMHCRKTFLKRSVNGACAIIAIHVGLESLNVKFALCKNVRKTLLNVFRIPVIPRSHYLKAKKA